MDSHLIAELVLHLARIASGDGLEVGLTPAQWTVLRYFARANRFSRTPSAFAEFHGTTRGTASQTIKSLVAEGYLKQTRSEADRRSTRLDLTEKGRAVLAHAPFEALVRASDALLPGIRDQFASTLQHMLGRVSLEKGKRPFGTCMSCAHLEGNGCCRDEGVPYACTFMGKPLNFNELEQLCIDYSQGNTSTASRSLRRGASR